MVLNHVPDSQVLSGDESVGIDQDSGRFVVEVPPAISDSLMLPGQKSDRFATPVAAQLPPRNSLLGLDQLGFDTAKMPRVLNLFPVAGDQEALQSQINASGRKGRRKWADFNQAHNECVPLAHLSFQGEGFGNALQGTVEFDFDAANFGEVEVVLPEGPSHSGLGIGDGVVAIPATKPWITGLLACFAAPVESLESPVHTVENVLENLAINFLVFR